MKPLYVALYELDVELHLLRETIGKEVLPALEKMIDVMADIKAMDVWMFILARRNYRVSAALLTSVIVLVTLIQ